MTKRSEPGYYNDSFGIIETALFGGAQWTVEQYRDTGFIVPKLRHDQDDFFQLKTQFNHKRKLQSVLGDMHIHITPMAAVSGDLYFSIAYHWHTEGDEIPAIIGWQSSFATIPILGTDQYKYLIKSFGLTINPPANEEYSSSLLIRVTRLGTSPNDTYNAASGSGSSQANLCLWYQDAHTLEDRQGSINTYFD